jgi:hypothetical protein
MSRINAARRRGGNATSSTDRTGHTIVPFAFDMIHPLDQNDTKNIPKGRSGHRIVCDEEENIYSFGGYNPVLQIDDPDLQDDSSWVESSPMLKELWKCNPFTRKWTKIPIRGTPPAQLASHSVVILGKKILVYGGTAFPFGQNSSNRIYTGDLVTGEWKHLKHTNSPDDNIDNIPPRQYGQAVVLDEPNYHIYVIGGTTGHEYSIDVHRFDLISKKWSLLWKKSTAVGGDVFPEERYRHECVLWRKKIYAFGGGTDQSVFSLKTIPVFDTETKQWIAIVSNPGKPDSYPLPPPRRCHGCVIHENYVYINGGMNGVVVFSDVWRFDLLTHVWEKINMRLPTPLFFHAVSLSKASGRMIVFGGVNRIVNTLQADVRVNDLYSVYLGVPSLQELSFGTFISHANPKHLSQASMAHLITRLGLPHKYAKRIISETNKSDVQISLAEAS